jgi:putative lipoprotein
MLPHETLPFGGYGKLFGFARDELIFFLFGGKKTDGSLDRTIWEGRSSILN